MIYAKSIIALIITLFSIIVVNYLIKDRNKEEDTKILTNHILIPTCVSHQTQILLYNPQGILSHQILADKSRYYSNDEISWFTNPVMIIYNENKLPMWIIKSNQAKLTKEKVLFLYGNVIINSLMKITQLKHLQTETAKINLITQELTSENTVTLSGPAFFSTGMKMYGNLQKHTAQIIGKVRTTYGANPEEKNKSIINNYPTSGL
ncbi:LPS export ABC transporter periplasmic protein LptC [Candidatus Erwinia haradaeae]|uniref:Lipopolysaccharide export system protein LptC n=1 Tax=Candidatus Erwinia haradaeae TaxID=1922217 RepID=A0A451D971_9GAMM|nr:LPS export ABC transporter periplasmic protein LptC [Candidatus Erwinia haradaeae]VFP82264.1 Lipopolysaccharide export system protein LptC [Candidatus Erwinia haradaeae]